MENSHETSYYCGPRNDRKDGFLSDRLEKVVILNCFHWFSIVQETLTNIIQLQKVKNMASLMYFWQPTRLLLYGIHANSCFCLFRNGGWTPWSSWAECSTSCGIGFEVRQRSCNNPAPRHGGRVCVGQAREERWDERKDGPQAVLYSSDSIWFDFIHKKTS